MGTRIVIFLAFVCIALISNTLLIWVAYRAFAGIASKVTAAGSQFAMNSETRKWISEVKAASEQAVAVTEAAKQRIIECDPMIENAQMTYRRALAKIDSTTETVAAEITAKAQKARDVVAGPAFSALAFAAGVAQFLENVDAEE